MPGSFADEETKAQRDLALLLSFSLIHSETASANIFSAVNNKENQCLD